MYVEHVCCPIERQITPLISCAAPCQSVPCRAAPASVAVWPSVAYQSAFFRELQEALFGACERLHCAAYAASLGQNKKKTPHKQYAVNM